MGLLLELVAYYDHGRFVGCHFRRIVFSYYGLCGLDICDIYELSTLYRVAF